MIRKRVSFIILFAVLCAEDKAFPAIGYLNMKGIHSLFSSECKDISPIHGFTLLKTHILRNIRFYGSYGPKKEPYGCHAQIRTPEQQQVDCPQDWTATLIQHLFPSPDRVNFVANQGGTEDPLSHLKMEEIARIVDFIRNSQSLLKLKGLGDEWTLAVFQAFYRETYDSQSKTGARKKSLIQKGKSFEQKLKQKKKELSLCRKSNGVEQKSKIEKISAEIDELKNSIKNNKLEQNQNLIQDLKPTRNWARIEPIAKILFHALEESHQESSIYPKDIVQQAFLAYAWEKATSKEDFIRFAQAIPQCVSKRKQNWVLANSDTMSEEDQKLKTKWLRESYKLSAYQNWKSHWTNRSPTQDQIKKMERNPELTAFYSYSFDVMDQSLPPNAGYSEATHKSLGKNKTDRKYNKYTNCGETSLRNFFNYVLYNKDERNFDISFLQQAQINFNLNLYNAPGKRNEKGLLAYYQGRKEFDSRTNELIVSNRNSDPAFVDDAKVHDDWSRRVVSGLKGVSYLKGRGQCEIDAGIHNMLSVIGALLGDPKWNQYQDPEDKWNRICEIFSRQDFKLDWRILGGGKNLQSDTGTLEFTINGKPEFKWYFESSHFSIEPIRQYGEVDWRRNIERNYPTLKDQPWFWSSGTLNDPKKIWKLHLNNSEIKLRTLDSVVKAQQVKELYPTVKNWIRQLPHNDLNTQAKIFDMITGASDYEKVFFESEIHHAKAKLEEDRKSSIIFCINENLDHALTHLNLTMKEFSLTNDFNNKTIAHVGAKKGNLKLLQHISDQSPWIFGEKTTNGYTSLLVAAESFNWEAVKLIAEINPELLKEDTYESPAHLAAFEGELEVLQYIVTRFPKALLQKTEDLETPAHFASGQRKLNILKYIAENAPETLEEKDDEGKSAFTILEGHVKSGKVPESALIELKEITKKAKADTQ